MSIMFIFILSTNNSSCLKLILVINYWKPYGNIRRGEKKMFVLIGNAKQDGTLII